MRNRNGAIRVTGWDKEEVALTDEKLRARFGHGYGKDLEQEVTCPKCGETFFIKR